MKYFIIIAFVATVVTSKTIYNTRIIGGESTKIEEHPYQISLHFRGFYICGGTIISEKFVVTTAHCTDGALPESLTIRAGTSSRNSGGMVVHVVNILQNPNYNANTLDYDISLLELATLLPFSEVIQAVKLPEFQEKVSPGIDAVCTGWGATVEGGGPSDLLQAVIVQIVDYASCNSAYNGDVTQRMICAGTKEGGKDACMGDSGGPLVVNEVFVGIISWGSGCGQPEYPGVYSSVPALRDFIKNNAGI